jgi:hypothetical protein
MTLRDISLAIFLGLLLQILLVILIPTPSMVAFAMLLVGVLVIVQVVAVLQDQSSEEV